MEMAQPDPRGDHQIVRAGRRALWLGIAALLMALLVAYLGLIMGVVALYVGIRTVRIAKRARSRPPGAMWGIVLASIALVVSIIGMGFQIFFWHELRSYSKCMAAANTITDENRCKDAFARSVEQRLHLPKGSFKHTQYL
jgi:hypothetical protein